MPRRSILLGLSLALATSFLPFAVPTTSPSPPAPFDSSTITRTLSKRVSGGVTLSTGKNFTGTTWSGAFPDETCIALNGFAGNTLSFRPDNGTECFVMQGHCNADAAYADLYHDSTDVGDLSGYAWIAQVQSYICFQAVEEVQSRVKMLLVF